MDKEGLLNRQGLWNRRGALLVGLIATCAFVGFNYFYIVQMIAALALFIAVWLPLLVAAFLLALLAWAGTLSLVRRSANLRRQQQTGWRLVAPVRWTAAWQWLAQPFARRNWRGVEWAGVRSPSRIDQWRRRPVRVADSRSTHHRRAA